MCGVLPQRAPILLRFFCYLNYFSDDPRAASNHGKGPFGCRRCAAAVSSATRSCSSPKWLARSPTAEARSKPNGWPSCALPHARRHDGVPAACASAAKCACSTGGPESCAITSARSSRRRRARETAARPRQRPAGLALPLLLPDASEADVNWLRPRRIVAASSPLSSGHRGARSHSNACFILVCELVFDFEIAEASVRINDTFDAAPPRSSSVFAGGLRRGIDKRPTTVVSRARCVEQLSESAKRETHLLRLRPVAAGEFCWCPIRRHTT